MHNHFPFFHIYTDNCSMGLQYVWAESETECYSSMAAVCHHRMLWQYDRSMPGQNVITVWSQYAYDITDCYDSMIAVCQDRMLSQYDRSMQSQNALDAPPPVVLPLTDICSMGSQYVRSACYHRRLWQYDRSMPLQNAMAL